MRRILCCAFLLVFLASSNAAFAIEARCGGKIIKPGLSKLFLINNCGEPDHTETFERGSRGRTAMIEKLYYYSGSDTYIVTIRNGTIERIEIEPR